MQRKSRWSLVVLALAILTVGVVAHTPARAESPTVPFKASVKESTFTILSFGPGPLDFTAVIAGTGNGTHLGTFSFTATATWTLTGPGLTWWCEGTQILVAANGDELHIWGAGPSTDPYSNLTYEITGGTGRFEDASGTGAFVVVSHEDGSQTVTWEGTISY